METIILNSKISDDIRKAGEILNGGGLVAIPTETVYGLAANALDSNAVKSIYKAKGRPSDNPLIVHVSKVGDVEKLAKNIPEIFYVLADKFWPGPLTIILEKSELIPHETSGGLETAAFRVPANKTARAIIESANCPLAAPSANISGKPSPTSFNHVFDFMNGRIDAIVEDKDCKVGLESTVISLVTNPPLLLRPGKISFEELKETINDLEIDDSIFEHVKDETQVSSPGMKYKHYSPKAKIIGCKLSFDDFIKLFECDKSANALCFDGEELELPVQAVTYGERFDSISQAKNLFSALHKIDEFGFKKVYARMPKSKGVGLAVYNRLIRACGFNVINPDVKIIGLTGPSGAGKTTVSKIIERHGFKVIDCDKITKDPATYTENCLKELADFFGSDILEDGVLNRRLLASKAFSSKENTKALNDITFPYILLKVEKEINKSKDVNYKKILLDAPTLFEAGADRYCTHILSVSSSYETRIERIIKRDNLSLEEVEKRVNSQKECQYYNDRADFVIENDDSDIDLEQINNFILNVEKE